MFSYVLYLENQFVVAQCLNVEVSTFGAFLFCLHQRQRRGFIPAWGNALSVAPGIESRRSEG